MKRNSSKFGRYAFMVAAYGLCLMLVVAATGLASYTRAVNSYNEEITALNAGSMSEYALIFQTQIVEEAENRVATFALDFERTGGLERLFYDDVISLSLVRSVYEKLMLWMTQSVDFCSDICLYITGQDVILSRSIGYYNIADHARINHYENTWVNKFTGGGGWVAPSPGEYPGQDCFQAMYAMAYPVTARGGAVRGYIVVSISEKRIRDILLSLNSEENEEFMLIDREGAIVSSTVGEHVGLSSAEVGLPAITAPGFGLVNYKIDGDYMILCHSAPLSNGWRVARRIPANVFYASSRALRTGMLFTIAGTVLVGAMLSLYFARRLYRPVQKLTRWLASDPALSTGTGDSVRNEYAFIDNAIRNMRTEIVKMRGELEDSAAIAKKYLVFSLLNGTLYSREDFDNRLRLLGYAATARCYSVVQVALSAALINAPDPQQVNLIKLDVLRQLEARSNEKMLVLASEIKNDELAAVIMADTTAVGDTLESMGLMFLAQYERHIQLSVGQWQDSPLKLDVSYRTALDAQKYHFFHPDWLYCSYDMISRPVSSVGGPLNVYERDFEAAVSEDRLDDAIDSLHRLSYEEQDHVYAYEEAMRPLKAMAEAVRAAAHSEEGRRAGTQFMEKHQRGIFKNIREYATDMCRTLYALFEQPVEEEDDAQRSRVIEQVMAYINQNLHTELSLTLLSEYTNLSSSYLSRLFKKETGETIVEYTTRQRLELARKLLEQTDQSIEMIAQQVGYPTHHYFSKKFKEHYGMTPKDYRQDFRMEKMAQ